MTSHYLPVSTGTPCSASMASYSTSFSSIVAHGRHSNLPVTILHSTSAGNHSYELISSSEVPEQPSWGNYPGLLAQAGHYADPDGGVLNNNGIDSVQRQQIPGSVGAPNESDDGEEWLRYLGTGTLDYITPTDIPADNLGMGGSPPVSAPPNAETMQNIVHQSVSVSLNSQQLYPTVPEPTPANANVHTPKRTKVRMRWTVEMHDRFIDAVNKLGGSENAKPKAILDIMKVEGLTREQVKSHLQKYKLAHVKHQSSEGTSVEMTTPSEAVSSDVQISIEALALQVQMEFQKKLHEMVEKTHRDLVEIHRTMLEKHVMHLLELEKRRKLSTDRTAPPHGSSTAAPDADGHASGSASPAGDNAGA